MQTASADANDCNRDTSRQAPPTPCGANKAARTNTTWGNRRERASLNKECFPDLKTLCTTGSSVRVTKCLFWKMRLHKLYIGISIPNHDPGKSRVGITVSTSPSYLYCKSPCSLHVPVPPPRLLQYSRRDSNPNAIPRPQIVIYVIYPKASTHS